MKQVSTLLASVFVLILLPITTAQAQPPIPSGEESTDNQADIQAIFDFEQSVFDAQIAGDFEAWMSSFTEDVALFPPNASPLRGIEAIRQFNTPIWEQFNLHEESDEREIQVAGDWAYIRAHWIWTLTPKSGGKEVQDIGNSIWILRRQPHNSWKITRAIWNSEKPCPTEE